MLAEASESGRAVMRLVHAVDDVDDQTAALYCRRGAGAAMTSPVHKVDPSHQWNMLLNGAYVIPLTYRADKILGLDRKTGFVPGGDVSMSCMIRYKLPDFAAPVGAPVGAPVAAPVAAARAATDPAPLGWGPGLEDRAAVAEMRRANLPSGRDKVSRRTGRGARRPASAP